MARSVDLLVVGAGPAGCAAAITAHERGLDVLVVDKANFPRDKTCGDGLTTAALRLYEGLGVDVPGLPAYERVQEVVLASPSGRVVTLPFLPDAHYSAVVPRLQLDAALVARARNVGVEVREGVGLVDLDTSNPNRVRAELSDGTSVDAVFVVAADGHWSPVRRLLEPDAAPDLAAWQAFRQYFHGVADHRQWVIFEPDLLPGYAWVFPLPGGGANVGFGVLRDENTSGKQLHALWADVITRPRITAILGPDAQPEGTHRAWPIPAAYTPARLTHGRVLYVGDAASVVDPMTGEGIAQAVESGILAATAVARGGSAAAVTTRYTHDVHRALGRDLRFAKFLQPLLASSLGARLAIRGANLTPWTRRHFARWMFEDYPRALALTPDRWHRKMWNARGAYRSGSTAPEVS